MKVLLLLAAFTYQIPLETLDGKTEQITVEDELQDGTKFIRCKEVGDNAHLICEVQDAKGKKFWVYIPPQ